jgi:signal transduction histidine kinase/CheY-like chemotaxis protein
MNQARLRTAHGMVSPSLIAPLQNRSQLNSVLIASAIYGVLLLLFIPFAKLTGPKILVASPLYAITMMVIDTFTFILLTAQFRIYKSSAFLYLASAHLYGALMAILHLLTFPGVFISGLPLIGKQETVAWLCLAWTVGFPSLGLLAICAQAGFLGEDKSRLAPMARILRAGLIVFAGIALLYLAITNMDLPQYFNGDQFLGFVGTASRPASVITAIALILIWRLEKTRNVLFLWLGVTLLAWLGGLIISAIGGGRFSYGWYASRVSYIAAGSVVLGALLSYLARLQQSLIAANEHLAEQTQVLQSEIQKREASEVMLVHAQKLEVVGQMTGGIAHDFNNFLQLVSMRIELMTHKFKDVGIDEDLSVIRRAIKRVDSMIKHLLSFSRRTAFHIDNIDLASWLPECLNFVENLLGPNFKVQLELKDDNLNLTIDTSELESALVNVILNARDAMPEGGVISVQARNLYLDEGNRFRLSHGQYIEIAVIDQGKGIPADILPRIFEAFFTTKEVNKGSGLGLAQVRNFTHKIGGTVRIDSEVEVGTQVRLILPLREHVQIPDQAEKRGKPTLLPRGSNILIVDDNKEVREASAELLRRLGFVVHQAGCAGAALDFFKSQSNRPSLVISDIVMSGKMNGIELARNLRKTAPDLPIILVTGFDTAGDPEVNREFRVLHKPYSLQELHETILQLATT